MSTMLDKRAKQLLLVLIDTILISASIFLSYSLRFNTLDLAPYIDRILSILPFMLAIRLSTFAIMGLYRGMWRFVGMRDLVALIQAATLSSALSVGILFLLFRLEGYPRSVFIIDWFVIIVLVGGSRFAYRLLHEGVPKPANGNGLAAKKVLIAGAGRAGEMLLREMVRKHGDDYTLIGFVDDDRQKRNLSIHGYMVLGNTRDIPRIVKKYAVTEVFLAMPSAAGAAKRRIMNTCKRAGVKSKTLPGVGQLLDGSVTVRALRDFQIDDLLGREPARLDAAAISEYLRGKTVLITGAGGSIGSELCRQVLRFSPKKLILFERNEFNLYQIQMNLLENFPGADVHPVIGDVLNQPRVERTLLQYGPEVVFHAAAYKHVPLMEMNAEEALRNNVFGAWNMAYLSVAHGVQKFVMVSTDKAVRPTNVMGATKRIAELICQGFNQHGSARFVTVRFGNVLDSVGSVIPLFRRQIAKGGPVTVTHAEICRYFMTIPEAVQLILQAGAMGQGGEIFLLDMGQPVKIVDLARDMIRLSGLEPGRDVKIVFTGLRPGEKLYEELLIEGEEVKATLHEKIKVVRAGDTDFQSQIEKIEDLLDALQDGISDEMIKKIREIVPEFQPENGGPRSPAQTLRDHSYEIARSSEA